MNKNIRKRSRGYVNIAPYSHARGALLTKRPLDGVKHHYDSLSLNSGFGAEWKQPPSLRAIQSTFSMDLRAQHWMRTEQGFRLTGHHIDMVQTGSVEHIESILGDLLQQLIPRYNADS
jgi:hypothetical protein